MKTIIEKLQSLDKPMIIRMSLQLCAILNEIIALVGMTSFAANPLYQTCSALVLIVISCLNAWKNNNFTHIAQVSGKVFDALKDGSITEEELNNILNKSDNEDTGNE